MGRAVGRHTRPPPFKRWAFVLGLALAITGVALEAQAGFTPGAPAFAWGLLLLVVGGSIAILPNRKALMGPR